MQGGATVLRQQHDRLAFPWHAGAGPLAGHVCQFGDLRVALSSSVSCNGTCEMRRSPACESSEQLVGFRSSDAHE